MPSVYDILANPAQRDSCIMRLLRGNPGISATGAQIAAQAADIQPITLGSTRPNSAVLSGQAVQITGRSEWTVKSGNTLPVSVYGWSVSLGSDPTAIVAYQVFDTQYLLEEEQQTIAFDFLLLVITDAR